MSESYPNIEILSGQCLTKLENPAITYPFECDHFQNHAFNSIENGNDVFVSVPTSGGKTIVGEYAIVYTIKKLKKKVIYTSPIKSLSNEKYNEFKTKFAQFDITVGLLTGDNKIDVNSDCLIVTAEILRNSLYQLKEKIECIDQQINEDYINDIGCVIMDEIHFMNDIERGKVWEETICMLSSTIQLVMLSATVSNPEKFVKWISICHQKKVSLIIVTKRLIPLEHFIYINNKEYKFLDGNNMYSTEEYMLAKYDYEFEIKERLKKHKSKINLNTITDVVKYLQKKELLQAMIFSFSRSNCEKYAKMINFDLIDYTERSEIDKIFCHYMSPYMKKYENVSQIRILKELFNKGVAFHHSGLLPILKEIVEIIFKKGLIKVLFCTETFAVGVNTPCRTVVFTELTKHTGSKNDDLGGQRFLTTAEYKQISGRAGRRGTDKVGHVILLPMYDFPSDLNLKTIVLGIVPEIQSKFRWDYNFFLKMIQSKTHIIDTFFTKSLIKDEHNNLLKVLHENLNIYKIDINKLNDNIKLLEIKNNDIVKEINTLLELDNKQNQVFGNVKLSLNKKELNEYKKIKKIIAEDKEYKKIYDLLLTKNNTIKEHDKIINQILIYNKYVDISCDNIKYLLKKWHFLNDDNTPSLKGIIASQINECNPIILTEIIIKDYLIDMTIEEIISFMSIFTEPVKQIFNKKDTTLDISDVLYDKIYDIQYFVDEMQKEEYEIIGNTPDFNTDWYISIDYIDITYKWGKGDTVLNILNMLAEKGEYEGNFVKNMLKISNIIHNVLAIYKMIGKIEMLPILEKVDGIIMRDIVSINSLYL